jgi:hypothetical protein
MIGPMTERDKISTGHAIQHLRDCGWTIRRIDDGEESWAVFDLDNNTRKRYTYPVWRYEVTPPPSTPPPDYTPIECNDSMLRCIAHYDAGWVWK